MPYEQRLTKPDFRVRHREYALMARRWEMAWDFWRGGVHVMRPDHDIMGIRWASILNSDDDAGGEKSELPAKISDWTWTDGAARSYLFKHDTELREEFNARAARLINLPVFQELINIFVAGILKTGPKRGDDEPPSEPWSTYWDDADLANTNLDALIRQALALALVFGRVHAITDRPHYDYDEQKPITRRDELDRGDRAYSYLVTPLDLVDWKLDEFGCFLWAVIREPQSDPRGPGMEPNDRLYQYRVWWRDAWELWREVGESQNADDEKEAFEFVTGVDHGLGRVPLSTLWATRDNRSATMFCESPLADALDWNRDLLNKFSESDELERHQTFSILFFPQIEGGPMGPVQIGPTRAYTGPAEAGAPVYVSPPSDLPDGKWTRIQDKTHMIKQASGAGRGRAEYSKEERSAASLSLEGEEKRNQMSMWAGATEEFDLQLHRDVNAWEGRDIEDFPHPSYPREYDFKGLASQINEVVQLNSTDGLGPNALAELIKPIAAKMLRESGTSAVDIAAVIKMIDKQAKEEPVLPPKPALFGGQSRPEKRVDDE